MTNRHQLLYATFRFVEPIVTVNESEGSKEGSTKTKRDTLAITARSISLLTGLAPAAL